MDEKKEILNEEELDKVTGGQGDWRGGEFVNFEPIPVMSENAD